MGKRVLVFGTFDGLHPGHVFFLRGAKIKGDELIVGVAKDAHVQELKGRRPALIETKRMQALEKQAVVDEVYLCDAELGSFEIISNVTPDLIVLGHDQIELEEALIRWMSTTGSYIPMTRMKKL